MPSPRTPASALSLASVPESFESGRVSVALGNCIVMSSEVPELPAGGAVKLAAIVLVVQVSVFAAQGSRACRNQHHGRHHLLSP